MTGDETLVSASMIFVTTNMAAAAGACTAMIVTWIHYGKPDVSMTLNGGLAGLVAIGWLRKGRPEMYRGAKVSAKLLPKVRVEMVVSKISPRKIIDVAKKVLYTGKYGDGKVFVSTIDNAVKIRTGEEGYEALQDYPINK